MNTAKLLSMRALLASSLSAAAPRYSFAFHHLNHVESIEKDKSPPQDVCGQPIKDLLDPAEVRAAVRTLLTGSILAHRQVGASEGNAAGFLMARDAVGNYQPAAPPPANEDLHPAYIGAMGGRMQRATGVERNLRTGRMLRDNAMRLLCPDNRPSR